MTGLRRYALVDAARDVRAVITGDRGGRHTWTLKATEQPIGRAARYLKKNMAVDLQLKELRLHPYSGVWDGRPTSDLSAYRERIIDAVMAIRDRAVTAGDLPALTQLHAGASRPRYGMDYIGPQTATDPFERIIARTDLTRPDDVLAELDMLVRALDQPQSKRMPFEPFEITRRGHALLKQLVGDAPRADQAFYEGGADDLRTAVAQLHTQREISGASIDGALREHTALRATTSAVGLDGHTDVNAHIARIEELVRDAYPAVRIGEQRAMTAHTDVTPDHQLVRMDQDAAWLERVTGPAADDDLAHGLAQLRIDIAEQRVQLAQVDRAVSNVTRDTRVAAPGTASQLFEISADTIQAHQRTDAALARQLQELTDRAAAQEHDLRRVFTSLVKSERAGTELRGRAESALAHMPRIADPSDGRLVEHPAVGTWIRSLPLSEDRVEQISALRTAVFAAVPKLASSPDLALDLERHAGSLSAIRSQIADEVQMSIAAATHGELRPISVSRERIEQLKDDINQVHLLEARLKQHAATLTSQPQILTSGA